MGELFVIREKWVSLGHVYLQWQGRSVGVLGRDVKVREQQGVGPVDPQLENL